MIYDIMPHVRRVLALYPFFGSVASGAEYIEAKGTGTVRNNGRDILYDPEYLAGLTDSQQLFVLAHELCHVAFGHKSRGTGRDPAVWDAAADAVINQWLKRDGLEIIPGGIDYPEAIEYDAESYYEILLSEKLAMDLIDGQMAGTENPAGGEEDSGTEKKKNGRSEEDDSEENESGSDDNKDDGRENDENNDFPLIQDDTDGGAEENKEDDENDDEEALFEERISDDGNAVRNDLRSVEMSAPAAPLLDWRLLLQDTINYGVDWSYTNAVMEDGIIRPVLQETQVPETEIVLDTSWSVDDNLLKRFLKECMSILTFSKMKAGCFDTVFYGFNDIRTAKDIDEMEFPGGGGTDFNAAVGAFTLRADNRIIFTDGQAEMPEMPLNAIWVVYGDEEISPAGGTVIHIRPEFMR